MNSVALTALLVAAIRAEESKRSDRLFEDPWADALAGDTGRNVLARYRASGGMTAGIEVRTRWLDEALARAMAAGIRQFVILAAGMDARAFRLPWPSGTRLFEVDQPDVVVAKQRALGDAAARCTRVAIGADLAGDWQEALVKGGFEPGERTAWLVEGLLQYLERAEVEALFGKVDALSARGCVALFDPVSERLVASPFLAPVLDMMRELGAPWRFGTDEPAKLLAAWDASVTDIGVPGNAWKRWPYPVAPASVPGGYLVAATKH
jgi:methyltransferase (TIGR00027 family)